MTPLLDYYDSKQLLQPMYEQDRLFAALAVIVE